ncbi:MAG: aldo/keto reductase [Coriobacteriia bacterium]|nr:aldo/keto reductase [Coriobacteriia bacterium]
MNTSLLTIENGFDLLDGTKIPRVGFGTYQLEAGATTEAAVAAALEAGYRHVDAARLYANERYTGKALAECGIPRNQLFVTSKVWNDRQMQGPDAIRASVEQSLAALRLDHLDLLLIHWPVAGRYRHTWEVFQRLQEEGLTTSIGVSNFTAGHLQDLLSDGSPTPVVDQMEHHPYMQDTEALNLCRELGIRYEAWSPFFRGKCLDDPVLQGIAEAHNATTAQVIVAWLNHTGVVALPRSSKPQRVRENLRGLELQLTAKDLEAIEGLNRGQYLHEDSTPYNFARLDGITSPVD